MFSEIKRMLKSHLYSINPAWKLLHKRRISSYGKVSTSGLDLELHFLSTLRFSNYVVDVGANSGLYSLALEFASKPQKIVLIEPNYSFINRLSSLFPASLVLPIAVGDNCNYCNLYIPSIDGRTTATRGSLKKNIEQNLTSLTTHSVYCSKLDVLGQLLGIDRISFVKIDVEGFELHVLRGSKSILQASKPLILIEIEVRHDPASIDSAISFMSSYSYQGFYISPESYSLKSLSDFVSHRDQDINFLLARDFRKYVNNFFFVHSSKVQSFKLSYESFLNHMA